LFRSSTRFDAADIAGRSKDGFHMREFANHRRYLLACGVDDRDKPGHDGGAAETSLLHRI